MNIWFNKQISERAQNTVWNLPALFGVAHSGYEALRCHIDIARLVKARNSILGKDARLQRKWCNVSTVLAHRKNRDIVFSHYVKFITKLVKFASASWMQMLLNSTESDCELRVCDKILHYHSSRLGMISFHNRWCYLVNVTWSEER